MVEIAEKGFMLALAQDLDISQMEARASDTAKQLWARNAA